MIITDLLQMVYLGILADRVGAGRPPAQFT
jgi:hypothetical protein